MPLKMFPHEVETVPFPAAIGKQRQHFHLLPGRESEEDTADVAAAHADGVLHLSGLKPMSALVLLLR